MSTSVPTDPATPDPALTDPPPTVAGPGDSGAAGSTRAVLVAVVTGAALAVCANASAVALLVAVAVVQAGLILTWVLGTGLPGRIGGIVIAGLAAAGADVGVSVWPHSEFSPVLAVIGLSLPVLFVHQLVRGVVRVRVVESLSDITLLIVSVVASASYLQLDHELDGAVLATTVTGVAALAVVVTLLVDLVWSRPRFDAAVPRGLTAVVLATAAAAAGGGPRLADAAQFTLARGLFVGAAVGAVSALLVVAVSFVHHGTSVRPTSRGRSLRPATVALLPIALVAPIAYLLCLSVG